MDEKKQIEEMAKDLQDCIDYDEWAAREYGETYVDYDSTAFNMVKLGYRKQSGWISVDERLPEADVRCLVWAKNVLWRIKFAWYYEPTKRWYVNIAGDIKDEVKDGVMITHWMPLPEPPKGD